MATISFGGAPGVYINEVAGQSAVPAIAQFSTVYMLVEVPVEVPTTLFPFNTPKLVTNLREYKRLIGDVIPSTKIELLSYQCVDSFFNQAYVGRLYVVRVGTPANVTDVQFLPSGLKTNGLGISSPLQAGDVVHAQLLINGARLGEFTTQGTWKGVPVEIPVDYVEGNYENNKKIAIAIRDAVALAIGADPNVAAGTIVRSLGTCDTSLDPNCEFAWEYLAGREFNAPISVVGESRPGSDGSFYVFTLNTYNIQPVTPDSGNVDEGLADYLQCLKTAFVDQEDQGYLTAPCAFAKFGPVSRALIGQEMARQAEDNSHKWMAIADAGPFNVTDIVEYQNFTQHEAAAPLVTNQEFLVGNTIYKWTAENTNFLQLKYTPITSGESNPAAAVEGSKNTGLAPNAFLSLRDDCSMEVATSTTFPFDKPGLLRISGENWPSTKAPGTTVTISGGVGILNQYNGEVVFVVPTYLNDLDKTYTEYVYVAASYPEAITAYNWIVSQGGLDNVVVLPPGCLDLDDPLFPGGLGDAATGVVIETPGRGYNIGDNPVPVFPVPATPGGRTATGVAVLGTTGEVDYVTIGSAGSGYGTPPTVTVTNAPGDVGSGASFTTSLATSGGIVSKLTLSNGGVGYESVPNVVISAPAASGGVAATATAVLSPLGSIKTLTLSNPGQNYIAAPSVSITGTGTGATATTALATTGGSVVGLASVSAGSLYTAVPSVALPPGTGSGATFAATLAPTGGVAKVTLSNNGMLYTAAPVVTISGDGLGATATAALNLNTGEVVSVNMVSGTPAAVGRNGQVYIQGTSGETTIELGYSTTLVGASWTILANGDNWTQANLDAALAGTYGTVTISDPADWIVLPVLQLQLGYALSGITVTNNGSGYTTASVAIARAAGDTTGVNAAASATIGKSVAGITVTSPGSGYISTDPNVLQVTPAAGDTTGTGAGGVVYLGFPLASVTLGSGGSGYDEGALVNVVNAPSDTYGSGAAISFVIGRVVTGFTGISGGSGYASGDAVTVAFNGGNPTTPAAASAAKGFGIASINIVQRGSGYQAAPTLGFVPSVLDAGYNISPAAATVTLGYGVQSVTITDAGSGYTDAQNNSVVSFSGGTPITPASGKLSLQAQGTAVITYDTPAWDLYVTIDGQKSDLIMNKTSELLDVNTLHLPGTLQDSTENFNVAQFTRTFQQTDISKLDPTQSISPAKFTCKNHGLTSGQRIFFTKNLNKADGSSFLTGSTESFTVAYYVFVLDGNTFLLASSLTNLNSRTYLNFPNGGLQVGSTYAYSIVGIARENTNAYSNEGVVNLIRGRKYGFNTYNVLPTFFPANLDPLVDPLSQGQAHTLGFYRVSGQPQPAYFSAYGESVDAGFLGTLNLRDNETSNFFCVPLVENERATSAYLTPTWLDPDGDVVRPLYGAEVSMRYTEYKEAPSNLWNFNAIPAEEFVDYALRGTFWEGTPACVKVATGIDDAQKLLEDSQLYFNPRGFIAYYGSYIKNASGAWVPPSPFVTGVAIRRYRSEGFQYPPAGVKFPLNGASEVQIPINSTQQDILNPKGCNVCRTLPGYGPTVFIWGGRTRINQDDAEQRLFQFVNTRVIMNVVYGSLRRAFDSQIFNVIDGFGLVYNKIISIGNSILNELYVRGALFGAKPGDAFQVICDDRINSPASKEAGIVNAKVFVVPVPTLERIQVDLIRVAIGNMQNELNALGVGEDNAL